ncbi:MAG: 1-acyl-sn-glycerol-3-phosphate acyltransferase [Sphingobacteriales bacterium]|nr:1-acyl-sn-glycerol-3-phosphate acyltransferase [Sphingobacteriales bacterium]
MRRVLGFILSPIHHLLFFFFLGIFHPIQWLSLKLGGYAAHKKSVDILNFFLISSYYAVGCAVSFKNQFDLPTDRPIIFTANHQSMYDIPPLIWFLRKHHAKFISKIELTKGIPSISFNLKHGGGANIDRSDKKQSVVEILKLGIRMQQNNWSAVIFPEGTRSKNGKMKEFQVGGIATILKKAPDALIVPIAIENSWRMVRYGLVWLNTFVSMKFTVLQPIEPGDKAFEDLVKEAEDTIKRVVEH